MFPKAKNSECLISDLSEFILINLNFVISLIKINKLQFFRVKSCFPRSQSRKLKASGSHESLSSIFVFDINIDKIQETFHW